MNKFIQSPSLLSIGTREVALDDVTQAFDGSEASLVFALDALLAKAAHGAHLQIALDDTWCRIFLVAPPRNAARMADCRAAASLRLASLFAVDPAHWHIEADWHAWHPFQAVAIPHSLEEALQQAADRHGLLISRMAPMFSLAAAVPSSSDAWLAVCGDQAVTLAVRKDGKFVAIACVPTPADGIALDSLLAREALRHGCLPPTELTVAGIPPAAWRTAAVMQDHITRNTRPATNCTAKLDLLRKVKVGSAEFSYTPWPKLRERGGRAAIVLAGLALAIAAQCAHQAWQHVRVRSAAEAQINHLEAQTARLRSQRAHAGLPALPAVQAQAVNRAVRLLNIPWRDLLAAFAFASAESSRQPETQVALISLEPDPQHGIVRGQAEAVDTAAMAAWLAHARTAGRFETLAPTGHELGMQDPRRPLRFSFEARWREDRP